MVELGPHAKSQPKDKVQYVFEGEVSCEGFFFIAPGDLFPRPWRPSWWIKAKLGTRETASLTADASSAHTLTTLAHVGRLTDLRASLAHSNASNTDTNATQLALNPHNQRERKRNTQLALNPHDQRERKRNS